MDLGYPCITDSCELRSVSARSTPLVEDPKWELSILANVSGFYQKLLRDYLHGELPVHPGLENEAIHQASSDLREILGKMQRWLQLLDMAITPSMVRQALTPDTDPEIAEALMRYYTRKRDFTDADRDKTDLVATFLYRHPRVPGQWERSGYGLDGALPLSPFEIALIEILADSDTPLLPEEHVQLLREFEPLREQIQGFQNFNALIDSGILSRVRELKQSFGRSFSHPGVLATIAPYNCVLGGRFDELFHAAISEIKNFARTGSGRRRVDEDRLCGCPGSVSQGFQAEEGNRQASATSPGESCNHGCERCRRGGRRRQTSPYGDSAGVLRKTRRPARHRATAFAGGSKAPPGGGVDPDLRAGSGSKVPPGCADAVLQSEPDAGRGRSLLRRLSGREKLACGNRARLAAERGRDRTHADGTGRTAPVPTCHISVETSSRRLDGAIRC